MSKKKKKEKDHMHGHIRNLQIKPFHLIKPLGKEKGRSYPKLYFFKAWQTMIHSSILCFSHGVDNVL